MTLSFIPTWDNIPTITKYFYDTYKVLCTCFLEGTGVDRVGLLAARSRCNKAPLVGHIFVQLIRLVMTSGMLVLVRLS